MAITVVMFVLDSTPMPRGAFVAVMVVAMLVKATLIAWFFMHLRTESLWIGLSVAMGMLALAVVLYGLIVPDALRIFQMSAS